MSKLSYVFVSGLDKTYSSRRRSLVLRRHFAQKAKEKAAQPGATTERSSSADSGEKVDGENAAAQIGWHDEDQEPQIPSPNLPSTLDDVSFDPFSSTALPVNAQEQKLLRFYARDFIYVHHGDTEDFNPCMVFFREHLHAPSTLSTQLTYAATFYANRFGGRCLQQALNARLRSIQLINEEIAGATELPSDEVITAVIGLLATDFDIFPLGGRSETIVHLAGLAQMLAVRGKTMVFAPWLEWLFYWVNTQSSGEISAALTRASNQSGLEETSHGLRYHDLSTSSGAKPAQPINMFFDELIDLYSRAYNAASTRIAHADQSLGHFFAPKSWFYELLSKASPESAHLRLAILLHLNILILDSVSDVQSFMTQLSSSTLLERLQRSDKDVMGVLVWLVLAGGEKKLSLKNRPRAELASRCLYVYKRLSWLMQARLEMAFMDFTLADCQGMASICSPATFFEAALKDLQQNGAMDGATEVETYNFTR